MYTKPAWLGQGIQILKTSTKISACLTAVLILIGIILLAQGNLPRSSHPNLEQPPAPSNQTDPSLATSRQNLESEKAELKALMTQAELTLPRPAKITSTRVSRNGYWEATDLKIVWLGLFRRILPEDPMANPEVVKYWVTRTETLEVWTAEFAAHADKFIASVPTLSVWAGPIHDASNALVKEEVQAQELTMSLAPPEEKAALRRAVDIEGKRQDLLKVVQGMLSASDTLYPQGTSKLNPVYEFLKQDADEQWTNASRDRVQKRSVARELRKTFFGAMSVPDGAKTHFETLETMAARLDEMMPKLIESALAPGQMPMSFLQRDAREFLDAQTDFDRELIRALETPNVRDDPTMMRLFDGLYEVWRSLDRHKAFLEIGAWAASLDLLAEISKLVTLAEDWAGDEFDPATGKSLNGFILQRAGQTTDILDDYRARWVEQGAPSGPLYAAVNVDEDGNRVWSDWNWVTWKWIRGNDLDDLVIDGRVVESLGRRWLLPAGSPLRSIQTVGDVHTANASEIIIGFAPSGTVKDALKEAP
jgi:hypothetical protein